MAFISKAVAFLMALFMTMVPYNGIKLPVLQTEEEDCLLNLAMISDTHVESNNGFLRQSFLRTALNRIENAKSPVDAVIIAGDITNYADEPALSQFWDVIKTCNVPAVVAAGNHDIGHAGDRDVTNISREEARENFIRYRNEYLGTDYDKNYYSTEINGYKFIILGDEVVDGGRWDAMTVTQEQLDFLDEQLAEGTAEGKPVFVVSHWPFDGINGEDTVWDGSGIEEDEAAYAMKAIMEKYKNVFYISGHMHGGVRCNSVGEKYEMPMAEQVNGVTYLSLPTFGIVNWFGLTWSGTGAQLEVYESKVVFRPVNYLTGNWYANSEYSFDLV